MVLYADDQTRAQVFKGLDKDYDRHLAQVENVRLLFMVRNDDSYAVRIRAVRIIGRLANMTPGAYHAESAEGAHSALKWSCCGKLAILDVSGRFRFGIWLPDGRLDKSLGA